MKRERINADEVIISGMNIKTLHKKSLIGRGNIDILKESSLNYSMGDSVAVDSVKEIAINTLNKSNIIIKSIMPTEEVEGILISQPYYKEGVWHIQIFNKSVSSFNGDLSIIYYMVGE